MTPERHRQIGYLFDAALTLEPNRRNAFLDHACADDHALRREVESLLASHEQAGEFIAAPALEVAAKALAMDADPSEWHPGQVVGPAMALTSGTQLGPYRILSQIGVGGMGEVYKALDTRLNRAVAVKVLPAHFSENKEMKQRFEREAQAIAGLNHPHICTLYDVGHQDGTDFLVMEFLEGETLAQRLERGALPLEDALRIAIEVAEALDKAHRQGVVHRDLKPSNVMLTKSGAKLLDFGLAKLKAANASALLSAPTNANVTAQGAILGTLQYMSPEQLEGKDADARTDIFAFGVVVYQMVTGKKPFEGESQASLIAAILDRDPAPICSVQPMTPAHLDHVVMRCLAKEADERWQAASDIHHELKWLAENVSRGPEAVGTAAEPERGRRRPLLMIACALLAVAMAVASILLWRSPGSEEAGSATRFTITVPGNVASAVGGPVNAFSSNVSVSADGRRIVFVAYDSPEYSRLYTRSMNSMDITPILGSEGATGPFLSPDGEWVAFIARGNLKKVAIGGGPPIVLVESTANVLTAGGGTWLSDGTIIFSVTNELLRISAAGGTPQPVTKRTPNEGAHVSPDLLPGRNAVLFAIRGEASSQIAVQSLKTGERKILVQDGANPRYLPTGHVLYSQSASLMALPFDKDKLEPTGPPFPVLDGLATDRRGSLGHFAASNTGTLVYIKGTSGLTPTQLVWVDRQGIQQPLALAPRRFEQPRLSPDGSQVAFRVSDVNIDVWIHNLVRGSITRLTFNNEEDETPIWAPDGKLVAFSSDRGRPKRFIFTKPPDGSANEQPIAELTGFTHLSSWTPNGKTIAYAHYDAITAGDIWTITIGERQPKAFLKTQFNEHSGSFSPDGRWIAYVSNESGRDEIYVVPYPAAGGRWQVSTAGGAEPVWSRDGKELFYRNGDKMMAVPVETRATFSVSTPKQLFEGSFIKDHRNDVNYDVSPDGKRFLMVKEFEAETRTADINVVLDWFTELQRQAAAARR